MPVIPAVGKQFDRWQVQGQPGLHSKNLSQKKTPHSPSTYLFRKYVLKMWVTSRCKFAAMSLPSGFKSFHSSRILPLAPSLNHSSIGLNFHLLELWRYILKSFFYMPLFRHLKTVTVVPLYKYEYYKPNSPGYFNYQPSASYYSHQSVTSCPGLPRLWYSKQTCHIYNYVV